MFPHPTLRPILRWSQLRDKATPLVLRRHSSSAPRTDIGGKPAMVTECLAAPHRPLPLLAGTPGASQALLGKLMRREFPVLHAHDPSHGHCLGPRAGLPAAFGKQTTGCLPGPVSVTVALPFLGGFLCCRGEAEMRPREKQTAPRRHMEHNPVFECVRYVA